MAETILSGGTLSRGGPVADVDSTGQQWVCVQDSVDNALRFFYRSSTGGAWSEDTSAELSSDSVGDYAFLIDEDDYAWCVALKGPSDGLDVYRAAVTAGSIGWTNNNHIADDVFTQLEGGGAVVQLAVCKLGSIYYVAIAARYITDDTITVIYKWNGSTWSTHQTFTQYTSSAGGTGNGSLDWQHTGDGKTVGSTPSLYRTFHDGNPGVDRNKFIRFYWSSGPTWTEETPVDFTPTGDGTEYLRGIFDGSTFISSYGDNSVGIANVKERNASNTTTTDRSPSTDSTNGPNFYTSVDVTYDPATRDIFLLSKQPSAGGSDLAYNRYDRSAGTWGGWTDVDTDEPNSTSINQFQFMRPGADSIIAIWDNDTASAVESSTVYSLNSDPTAPTITSPTDGEVKDVAEVLPVVWTFNDPDAGDTQGAYSLRKQIGTGSYSYWNGSVFTASESAATKISSSGTTHTISSSWGADGDANHKYAIKTWDAADAGPSDWDEVYVTPSAQDNPTVTAITTVTAPTYNVTWTVATQTKYRVKVYDDSGGSPVTSTVFYNSGIQVSAVTSHTTPFPDNNVTRHVGVQTWNDEGLLSDEDTEQLAVEYPSPPTPTVSMSTTGSESGVIWVSINNPTPGGGETVTDSNEVYRRVASEGGDGIRIAEGVAEDGGFNDYGPLSEVVYQYRARAINAGSGTGTYGAWTT